jgi:hypothetical protein
MRAADRMQAALKRGVDELQSRLEYVIRDCPRAVRYAQKPYIKFALILYRAIERADR